MFQLLIYIIWKQIHSHLIKFFLHTKIPQRLWSPFLVGQSLTKATPLELEYWSGTTCIPSPDSTEKKHDTPGSNSPHHQGKVEIVHPLEVLSRQILFTPGMENEQYPGCARGILKVRIDRRTHWSFEFYWKDTSLTPFECPLFIENCGGGTFSGLTISTSHVLTSPKVRILETNDSWRLLKVTNFAVHSNCNVGSPMKTSGN